MMSRLLDLTASLRFMNAAFSVVGSAAKFDHTYARFKEDYEKTYRDLTRIFPNLADAEKAAKDDLLPYLTSAGLVYVHGRNLSDEVLKGKEIPVKQIKKFERAYKTFHRTRRIKDHTKWFLKDLKLIQVLLEANQWPDKGATETRTKQVGPFKVLNQVGGDMAASEKLLASASNAIRRSGVPNAAKTLYGDVLIVGAIQRKHGVAALYYPSSDHVVLLLLKRFSGKHETALIHEFGHRLWTKFLPNKVKSAWLSHHETIKRKRVDFELPEVGEPLEVVKGKPKVVEYKDGKIYVEGGGYVGVRQFQNFMESKGKALNFPTAYSSTDPEEHFCEAFALYCLGSLKEPHKTDFEALVVRGQ